jgi:hypothetical protein
MSDFELRQTALNLIQTADIAALHSILQTLDPDADRKFLARRRAFLHALLESYESDDPALAARLQAEIDKSAKNFPFDY